MTTTAQTPDKRPNVWRIAGWSAAAFLFLLPLVAMQFTDEVNWKVGDFAVFGVLLAGVGVGLELAVRRTGNTAYRFAAAVAVVGAFLLVWANLAVGLVGAEGDPFDLFYFGVPAVMLIGAYAARFRPGGMARTMFAAALFQAGIVVIALMVGKHHAEVSSVGEIVGGSGFFILLWVWSALLFRQAVPKK